LHLDPDLLQPLAELESRAVQDRDLAVDLDEQVGDPIGVKRGEQVLDCADALALARKRVAYSVSATESRCAGIWVPLGTVRK